jgi:hypothetical protein
MLDVEGISAGLEGSHEDWVAAGDRRRVYLRLLAGLAGCQVSDGTEVEETQTFVAPHCKTLLLISFSASMMRFRLVFFAPIFPLRFHLVSLVMSGGFPRNPDVRHEFIEVSFGDIVWFVVAEGRVL